MQNLKSADHIYINCSGYHHHGLYIGGGKVLHYSGFAEKFKKGAVTTVTLKEFLGDDSTMLVMPYTEDERKFSPEEVVSRGLSRLDENDYHLFDNNCEHFVSWCITGEAKSKQVESAKKSGSALSARVILGGAAATVVGSPVVAAVASVGLLGYAGKKAFDYFRNK
jgi:hypothetical protein